MLIGRVFVSGDQGYAVELPGGESFNINKNDLPESLRENGKEIRILFGAAEEAESPQSARELINYLLHIQP